MNLKKGIKISGWTLGTAFAAVLIVDGKSLDQSNVGYHAIEGGVVGFMLGSIFARKRSTSSRA